MTREAQFRSPGVQSSDFTFGDQVDLRSVGQNAPRQEALHLPREANELSDQGMISLMTIELVLVLVKIVSHDSD